MGIVHPTSIYFDMERFKTDACIITKNRHKKTNQKMANQKIISQKNLSFLLKTILFATIIQLSNALNKAGFSESFSKLRSRKNVENKYPFFASNEANTFLNAGVGRGNRGKKGNLKKCIWENFKADDVKIVRKMLDV